MRNSLFILFILSFAQASQSAPRCFEFDVQKFSPGMQRVTIQLNDKNAQQPASAKMAGFTEKGESLSAVFECERVKSDDRCIQKDGAGAFYLGSELRKPLLMLTYINLRIANYPTAKVPPNVDQPEIDEIFAIYQEGDDDEDESHLENVSIPVKSIKCESKI
jgi:hypothetical protein